MTTKREIPPPPHFLKKKALKKSPHSSEMPCTGNLLQNYKDEHLLQSVLVVFPLIC